MFTHNIYIGIVPDMFHRGGSKGLTFQQLPEALLLHRLLDQPPEGVYGVREGRGGHALPGAQVQGIGIEGSI